MLYPPQCILCRALVEEDFALCGGCRRDTWFISGLVCDACGVPLPGTAEADERVLCDDCLKIARPWVQGRAALIYRDTGRKLVLALKHGDRTDLVRPLSRWMSQVASPILLPDTVVVPIPLNRWRFFKRRYNQAALLARAVADQTGLTYLPDALIRPQRTRPLDGMSVEQRFETLSQKIRPHPRRSTQLKDRSVLLVDDVMTSGATLAAATEACLVAGATRVCVLTLARVAKDD
ncbi:ComF family protein [Actibacterium pelagium]|nr:ComF family protein [Actibacterium pelagium]